MKMRLVGSLVAAVTCTVMLHTAIMADDVKSGKRGGAFNVKAITGDQKGKTLCYV